jgi:hypothetical protein
MGNEKIRETLSEYEKVSKIKDDLEAKLKTVSICDYITFEYGTEGVSNKKYFRPSAGITFEACKSMIDKHLWIHLLKTNERLKKLEQELAKCLAEKSS